MARLAERDYIPQIVCDHLILGCPIYVMNMQRYFAYAFAASLAFIFITFKRHFSEF
jgi:hypothetical protein